MRDHFVDEPRDAAAVIQRRNSVEVRDVCLEVQTSVVDRSFGKCVVVPLKCSAGDQSLTCVLWVSGREKEFERIEWVGLFTGIYSKMKPPTVKDSPK